MKFTLSSEQESFFKDQGWVEIEPPSILPLTFSEKPDLFREDPKLKKWILSTLGPIALTLARRKALRLIGADWIAVEKKPKKLTALKELSAIQNLPIAITWTKELSAKVSTPKLGIFPGPQSPDRLLFLEPHLLIDWSYLSEDLFVILFGAENAVYTHNPNDPKSQLYKDFGYEYGDPLQTKTHPLIFAK